MMTLLTINKARLRPWSRIAGLCAVLLGFIGVGIIAPSASDARVVEEPVTVNIDVKTRQFLPETVTLSVGRPVTMVLRNLDAELHAFVPIGLLLDTHSSVSGNGAPQFGKTGLVRVLLPSTGQTEIAFTPHKAGKYTYFCDLPGHVMRGTIVVQE